MNNKDEDLFVEPTSEKIYKLLQKCKDQCMNRYDTSLHISGELVDDEEVDGIVHINYMDLVGLILNISRNFEG